MHIEIILYQLGHQFYPTMLLTCTRAGNQPGPSSRGGGRLRGLRGGRRYIPYSGRHIRPRGAKLSSYHSTEECNQSSSDDSTQPPSPPPCVVATHAPQPIQEPQPNTDGEQSPTGEQTGACFSNTLILKALACLNVLLSVNIPHYTLKY